MTSCSRRSFAAAGLAGAVSSVLLGVRARAQAAAHRAGEAEGAAPDIAEHEAAGQSDPPVFRSGRFQFTIIRPQIELPSIRLFGFDGRTADLRSFRGRPILLNFWASWCDACRMELPVLDSLLGETDIHVLAVSEDRGGRKAVRRFLEKVKIRHLPIYLDPNGYVAHTDPDNKRNAPFALYGMPITYLIASSGRVIGYMPGAADWRDPTAKPLIDYLRST